jgi:c(7)-type cytochrome triheme protein
MRKVTVVLTVLFVAAALSALAVPPGKTLEYTNSSMGKVVFDGTVHAKAVSSCKDCHKVELFPEMKKIAAITMKDIYEGRYCGVCHNGTVTFEATNNCSRCHRQ